MHCTEKSELHLDEKEPYWELPKVDRSLSPPKRRTKNGLPHCVPLPPLAASLFKRALALSNDDVYVFPSSETEDGILGEYTQRQAVERLFSKKRIVGFAPFTPKDFRPTLKTFMASKGIPVEVRDRVQNHKPAGIGDRVYNKHDYFTEKLGALTAVRRQGFRDS